jgi:hypothetical protein
MQRPSRLARSAGTATPLDVLRRGFRPPGESALAADLAAIDRGDGRTLACLYRGAVEGMPRRFRRKMLDLTADGLVFRPFWSSPSRSRFGIDASEVTSAHLRPPHHRSDLNVPATGVYQRGGIFDYAGFEIIQCQTTRGQLELAVPRPDVPLVLHYLHRTGGAATADGDAAAEGTD